MLARGLRDRNTSDRYLTVMLRAVTRRYRRPPLQAQSGSQIRAPTLAIWKAGLPRGPGGIVQPTNLPASAEPFLIHDAPRSLVISVRVVINNIGYCYAGVPHDSSTLERTEMSYRHFILLPTAPYFHTQFGEAGWAAALAASSPDRELSRMPTSRLRFALPLLWLPHVANARATADPPIWRCSTPKWRTPQSR